MGGRGGGGVGGVGGGRLWGGGGGGGGGGEGSSVGQGLKPHVRPMYSCTFFLKWIRFDGFHLNGYPKVMFLMCKWLAFISVIGQYNKKSLAVSNGWPQSHDGLSVRYRLTSPKFKSLISSRNRQ